MPEEQIGKITHYFTGISVAVVKLSGDLEVGDKIHIQGATTDFTQEVKSMQIEHDEVKKAGEGQSVGLKVKDRVREGDDVFKV